VDSEGVFVWVFCVCGKIEYAGILDGCTIPERWLEMVVVMGSLEGFWRCYWTVWGFGGF
jgi:hypothetical protein